MLFHHGLFSPELVPDQRVREVLSAAVQQSGNPFCPMDVLAGTIQQGDAQVLAILARALRPGSSMQDLFQAITAGRISSQAGHIAPRSRESFTPQSLQAFDEFEAIMSDGGVVFADVALEVLLHCVLVHLGPEDRSRLTFLDDKVAAEMFREQVTRTIAPSSGKGGPQNRSRRPSAGGTAREGEPFCLPPQLLPSEDLTYLAETAVAPGGFPFDGEPTYDSLFDAIARVLHRRQGNHVFLTGERGVGKNTVLAELARRSATGLIPFLRSRRFLRVDCRHIPPDESRQRLTALFAHVAGHPELIVCLDGFASLLRSERGADNKPVFLAALTHARCQLIGLLTPREFEELISDDPDFTESFARVEIEEPSVDVALKLLRHFALGLEQQFRVCLDEIAVRQAVLLSDNYILNDQLPAKALKILHRVCEDIDYERYQQGSSRNTVTVDDIINVVSQISGVPEETLRGIAERSDYEQSLREVIFGQDHAVRAVATELGLIKAGMIDPDKPASVMLFLGPTGAGKTEMAKALARFYSTTKRLKTYTLGNCVEPHSVATIIGVPPGYVGTDQGGRLINELNADPYCVFLLDEADKAHPDVLQPFLNLFDEGWVCDQRGVRAYANKSIFILTTNVGQRMITELFQQGKSIDEITVRMKEALSQIRHTKSERPVFTPEFLARIKRIIVFNPLDLQAMAAICRKLVAEMQQLWNTKRGKRLHVPDPLIDFIAGQAHQRNEKSSHKEGGRLVRKLISEWIEAPIQREISLRPGEYKTSGGIALDFVLPEVSDGKDFQAEPAVTLRFLPSQAS